MAPAGDLANDLLSIGISLPFPAALRPLDGRLRQIRSTRELQMLAKRFDNCVSDYAQRCMDGVAAIYVWNGEEPAVVAVQKFMGSSWTIDDVCGPKNVCVSHHARQLIRQSFPIESGELIYDGLWLENLIL